MKRNRRHLPVMHKLYDGGPDVPVYPLHKGDKFEAVFANRERTHVVKRRMSVPIFVADGTIARTEAIETTGGLVFEITDVLFGGNRLDWATNTYEVSGMRDHISSGPIRVKRCPMALELGK